MLNNSTGIILNTSKQGVVQLLYLYLMCCHVLSFRETRLPNG